MAHYEQQRDQHENKKEMEFTSDILRDWDLGAPYSNIAISLSSTDWYDYNLRIAMALPPVGTQCEYTLTGNSWYKCSIVSHNNLVIACPHIAEIDDNGNGLQVVHPDAVSFRPLNWDRTNFQAEFNFHLSNCINEIKSAMCLLPANSPTHEMLSHSLRLIEEVKGGAK